MSNSLDARALALLEQSFDHPSADRAAWIASSDATADVRERALTLLSQRDLSDRLRTGGVDDAFPATPLPSRIGAYRVTGLIGQGGMGAVYRGQRAAGDFEHDVAIKVVRPGALSDTLTERFAAERQTLARLAHPNIARLFDGGATEEGAPYIVMELIDGVPLDDWLAGEPDKPARLRLFLGICSAVGFAHQNLIIHRDITPANILVERDGVPKLIDFGIARPSNETEPTGPLPPEGMSWTPGFAAPERLTGGTATTLGDIYGLGRLLERLFPAGRDRDLAAITAMATAVDPAARYPSADALAEDVKAWRDGFPVAARRGGTVYGARRFAARHPFAVSAALLVAILSIGAAVAILQANARAERERAQAIARFEQTRSIAKTMMFDVFDLVSRLPSSTRAREALARSGLHYLDALAADPDAPFDVRVETGRGYARLASVIGSGEGSTLGALADGTKLLEKATAILQRAYQERPGDAGARRNYASVLVERAIVALYNDNDPKRARAEAERAQRLVASDARSDPESARVYALCLQTQADSWGWDDDWIRARPLLLENEAFITSLPAPIRDTRLLLLARSANLRILGEVHHKLKEENAARDALDRAVAINEGVLARDPSDPVARRRVATTNWYRAVVHRTAHRDALAADSIARAAAAAKTLRDADPADAGSAHLWAIVAEVQSQILMDIGQREQAFDVSDQVTAEYRRLIGLSGEAPGMRRSFSAALRTIGSIYYNGGDFSQACSAWRESRALLAWLEAHGSLTEMDRKNGLANVTRYLTTSCDKGPPRAGLGSKID